MKRKNTMRPARGYTLFYSMEKRGKLVVNVNVNLRIAIHSKNCSILNRTDSIHEEERRQRNFNNSFYRNTCEISFLSVIFFVVTNYLSYAILV